MSVELTRAREFASSPDTRAKILHATENLIVQEGPDVSLRRIAESAGVNIASVHYHFGSKEGLIRAAMEELAVPISEARIAALEEYKKKSGDAPLKVEQIVEIFVRPYVCGVDGHRDAAHLLVRIALQNRVKPTPLTKSLLAQYLGPPAKILVDALAKSLPHLSKEELYWRFHFTISLVYASLTGLEPDGSFAKLAGDACDVTDDEAIVSQLVAFISAGLKVPSTKKKRS